MDGFCGKWRGWGGRENGERLGNGEKDKKEGLHKLRKGADQKRRGKHIERYRKGWKEGEGKYGRY